MRTLIIGAGEIGKSLYKVLSKEYITYKTDINFSYSNGDEGIIDKDRKEDFDIIHICFPYSKTFIKDVKAYRKFYNAKYVVIHSTVPVGTSRKCDAIHSPVVGIHPNLEEGILTFRKFLGGEKASEVANYFRRANINVYLTDKSETTELMKILCTTVYGLNIEITKEIKRLCKENDVPFEMWTLWTNNYNDGYVRLNHPEFVRQNLVPIMTKQGGHCTINNTNLLTSWLTKTLRDQNNI